jgi:hypothetical protein
MFFKGSLHFLRRGSSLSAHSVQGSALLLFMVLLTTLSVLALGALETAWSGQRMISAYLGHQQTFVQLESVLRGAEQRAWQHIKNAGLEQFLADQPYEDNLHTASQVVIGGEWIITGFSEQHCGPLFQVGVTPVKHTNGGALSLSARWDICCETTEACLALEFTQVRRLWSRSADVSNDGI